MDCFHFATGSPEETAAFGERIGALLQAGDVALLSGDLGAGKSALARGIARGFGVTQSMPSPTFTLMKPYAGRAPFYHFDLYRLNEPEEFYVAGLDEYLPGDGAAAVEWPERADLLIDGCLELFLTPGAYEQERKIEMRFRGFSRAEEMLLELVPWRMAE